MRRGHRPSALDTARFCGKSALLGEEYGAGRAANMSKAFHALCAEDPKANEMVSRLSHDEQAELAKWKLPTDCEVAPGVMLSYEDADKEVPIGVDDSGNYVLFDAGKDKVLTRGYIDFAWVKEVNGKRVAYVCDLKKNEWTTALGPESLQLVPYAFAYSSLKKCDLFCTGIWHATEGTWWWSEMKDPWFEDKLWNTAKAAALNHSKEGVTGPHCRDCYGRLHCEEHLIPAAALTKAGWTGDLDAMSAEGLGEVVLQMQGAQEMAKKVLDEVKERARRGQDVLSNGKRYRAIEMRGREGVSVAALRKRLGDEAEQYVKRGAPYSSFRWTKA